jgi:DNA-binding XRE family transcriptional regulator
VQFVGELKHCRRCPVNFTEPAADDAMAADLALAAPGVDASRAIRFCRRACGLSQNEVARRMGVTRTHISKLENGQMPTAFTAMKLARAIGIPMWFFCALCEIGGRLG